MNNKKDRLCTKFSSRLLQGYLGAPIPYFGTNAPFFCWPLFVKEYLCSKIKIKKVVNSVDY